MNRERPKASSASIVEASSVVDAARAFVATHGRRMPCDEAGLALLMAVARFEAAVGNAPLEARLEARLRELKP